MRRLLGQRLSIEAWDQMTFNDKVHYRRLRVRDPLLTTFSDKLSMREYVAERLGEESLPALLAVGETPSELNELRGPYVLKANHGSGMVTFIREGEVLSREQSALAQSWLDTDYSWLDLEWGYRGARRLLLAEEFLRESDGSSPPSDYKLLTFHGEVKMIAIHTDRFVDHRQRLRRPDWTPITGRHGWYPSVSTADDTPPAALATMLDWASRLGQDLDLVRVDLYATGGRVLVGELTPYPGGGNERFRPATLDAWLGRMW